MLRRLQSGPLFYPQQLSDLDVHLTKTVLLFDTQTPNLVVDISNVIERKIETVNDHKTQFGTRQRFVGELRKQFANTGRPFGFDYAETYHVLELR